jgi:diguanylate cyclase (GGDEF)-like protein
VIERTPLAQVGDVKLDLLRNDAAPLIADILGNLTREPTGVELELPNAARQRASGLGRLRRGSGAVAEIPRDLGALQSLLIESLRRDVPEQRVGDFAHSVGRLADIFGSIQGAITEELVRERAGHPSRDELTDLPGHAELHEWLQVLLAEYGRYGHPFALALVDIEGLGRINDAYGREAGDRMVAALAIVIRDQIRAVDRPFRVGDDEFCVVAPHQAADRLVTMAHRLADVVQRSQAPDGPRIAVSIGISSCPDHGDDAQRLLDGAQEATYSAKAGGRPVAVASSNGPVTLQDR